MSIFRVDFGVDFLILYPLLVNGYMIKIGRRFVERLFVIVMLVHLVLLRLLLLDKDALVEALS